MSRPSEIPPDVGAARMLAEALRAALAPGADAESFAAARTAAQIAGLDGLDACLAALEPHRGAPWPPPFAAIADRVTRITSAGRLQGFRDADRELGAHAAEVSGMHWERAAIVLATSKSAAEATAEPRPAEPAIASVATVSAAEALEELPLAGAASEEVAKKTRLTVAVAAALRAALEWLTRETPQPKPFVLRGEDSVLEVMCEAISASGLTPASEALAAADGNLSPVGDGPARAGAAWLVRVPAWSARPLHLMFEQGPLRLAVPWHSVLRMSLVPAIELELRRESLATPMIAPLAPLIEGIGERPVIAIASGGRRGLLVADRLVWRLAGEPLAASDPSPHRLLTHAVRSEEGDWFWVIEPRLLLEGLPVPALAAPAEKPKVEKRPGATPPSAPKFAAKPAEMKPVASSTRPAPLVLQPTDVEPLLLGAADVVPLEPAPRLEPRPAPAPAAAIEPAPRPKSAPAPAAAPQAPPAPESFPAYRFPAWMERLGSPLPLPADDSEHVLAAPVVVRSESLASRPVLIAEDSLAARHFLARLFEREGFEPQAVASAGELCRALATRPWSLVAVDVELPDAHGATWLAEVRGELERAEVPCVALVRDDQDAELAREAGILRWLRKPFDREELAHLLRVTRLIPGESA